MNSNVAKHINVVRIHNEIKDDLKKKGMKEKMKDVFCVVKEKTVSAAKKVADAAVVAGKWMWKHPIITGCIAGAVLGLVLGFCGF